jgi:hypothetical protein
MATGGVEIFDEAADQHTFADVRSNLRVCA